MKLDRHVRDVARAAGARVVAVGDFDGVHRGHQRVLARVVARAAELGGEPMVVLRCAAREALALTGLRTRLALLESAGIERVALVRETTAGAAALVAHLAPAVWVSGAGPGQPLPATVALDVVPPLLVDGEPVTAAGIRAALAGGDLEAARRRLGRRHAVEGRVIHGFHRGKPLGIPTANLRLRGVQLPPDGVYAVLARTESATLRGVANIGFNPTFGNRQRSVEAHLFDFDGDLYGQRLTIEFVAALRGERKFRDANALLAQIHADIAAARRLFATHDD